ncbi:hypothetical protein M1B72_07345 [Geomonas paludis]|uniref:Tyr recombinase domain-containing protein n=1 Tax=Geomonas paludis TaxID=2740185 RepID=A0ABY4LK46_9BACT|nr:hypothetical protein [Geomonas paludis]UPU37511.1 hypothetical protein M1B72_07345 [Geomonas paludis]
MRNDLDKCSGSGGPPEIRSHPPQEASGDVKRWSNGKPRLEKPSVLKPRNRKGGRPPKVPGKVKGGKTSGGKAKGAKSGKKSGKERSKSGFHKIPVLPQKGPKASHRKTASLEYEFKHRVIGKAHNIPQQTRKKAFNDVKQICKAMEKHPFNLNSIRSMSEKHIKQYSDMMRNGDVLSQKTGEFLAPSTVYDRVLRACWMYNSMNPGKKLEPRHIGVQKLRIDIHKPVDFGKHPDYAVKREAVHQFIRNHEIYGWLAPGDRLGSTFGLREDERVGTRGHTITRMNGQLCVDKGQGKGYEKVSTKQIRAWYGNGSYVQYVRHVKEGEEYLIPEWAKGSLGRYVEVENREQWAAIKEVREACAANNSKSGRIIPDGMTKKQAEDAVKNSWQAAKKELGLKGRENYAYTTNGDRGHYVQDCCDRGLSDKEIITRMGHFDTDKLDFYRDKAKYK